MIDITFTARSGSFYDIINLPVPKESYYFFVTVSSKFGLLITRYWYGGKYAKNESL